VSNAYPAGLVFDQVGTSTCNGNSTFGGSGWSVSGISLAAHASCVVPVSVLAAGSSNSITASYGGDANFLPSTSNSATSVTVATQNFTIAMQGQSSITLSPGASATYELSLSPTYGSYPGAVNFTASGLPPGATASFSPTSIAANAGPQTVTATIKTASSAALRHDQTLDFARRTPLAVAIFLLSLMGIGRLRRGAKGLRGLLSLVMLLGGIAASAGIMGCCVHTGFQSQPLTSYTVTITAASGTLQHTTAITINVQ
jgi:large repetitive protein